MIVKLHLQIRYCAAVTAKATGVWQGKKESPARTREMEHSSVQICLQGKIYLFFSLFRLPLYSPLFSSRLSHSSSLQETNSKPPGTTLNNTAPFSDTDPSAKSTLSNKQETQAKTDTHDDRPHQQL
jgi:hypothetical protein